jgi:hypothetical protein
MPALGNPDILTFGSGERVVMLQVGQHDSDGQLGIG